jgi:hypothetical protein
MFSLSAVIFTVYVAIVRLIDASLDSEVKFQFVAAFKRIYSNFYSYNNSNFVGTKIIYTNQKNI